MNASRIRGRYRVIGVFALLAAGCAGGEDAGEPSLTKDDVRGGKGDHSTDYCEKLGWYDDGVCDDFCPHPDPDCTCPDVLCALFCENGFATGDDGCPICECNEPIECPEVLCALYCEHGFKTDDDGCEICECNDPPTCLPVVCDLWCEHGYRTDETGCQTCECNDPPECPDVICALFCSNGFATGEDGCPICECVDDDGACGGHLGLTCADDEFCHYELDEICGAADHLGTCQPRPEACAEIYAPVCGCDGQTYGNECEANGAGTSAASEGECASSDCRDAGCGEGDYCSFCWGTWQCIPDGAVC